MKRTLVHRIFNLLLENTMSLEARIKRAATLTNAMDWDNSKEQLLFCEDLLNIDETELGWKAYDKAIHDLEDRFIEILTGA